MCAKSCDIAELCCPARTVPLVLPASVHSQQSCHSCSSSQACLLLLLCDWLSCSTSAASPMLLPFAMKAASATSLIDVSHACRKSVLERLARPNQTASPPAGPASTPSATPAAVPRPKRPSAVPFSSSRLKPSATDAATPSQPASSTAPAASSAAPGKSPHLSCIVTCCW